MYNFESYTKKYSHFVSHHDHRNDDLQRLPSLFQTDRQARSPRHRPCSCTDGGPRTWKILPCHRWPGPGHGLWPASRVQFSGNEKLQKLGISISDPEREALRVRRDCCKTEGSSRSTCPHGQESFPATSELFWLGWRCVEGGEEQASGMRLWLYMWNQGHSAGSGWEWIGLQIPQGVIVFSNPDMKQFLTKSIAFPSGKSAWKIQRDTVEEFAWGNPSNHFASPR